MITCKIVSWKAEESGLQVRVQVDPFSLYQTNTRVLCQIPGGYGKDWFWKMPDKDGYTVSNEMSDILNILVLDHNTLALIAGKYGIWSREEPNND